MSTPLPYRAIVATIAFGVFATGVSADSRVFWRNHQTGANHIYDIDGAAISQGLRFPAVTDTQWQVVATPDLNGDGETDLVWRHFGSGQNYAYLFNNGQLVRSKPINVVNNFDWQLAGSGDFNNDGNDDLVWRHQVSGDVYLYEMQGEKVINARGIYRAAPEWKIVSLNDFNHDGHADILWRHQPTGAVLISLFSNGELVRHQAIATVADLQWKIEAVADFNGDGHVDLLWRNHTSGVNYLYFLENERLTNTRLINSVDTAWQVGAVADFNQDDNADIMWHNSQTGMNYLYLMNGATIAQGALLNTVSDLNWQPVATLNVDEGAPVVITGVTSTKNQYQLPVGGSVQLDLTAHYSDSTMLDVTHASSWLSSNPDSVSVTAGMVQVLGEQGATITASYQQQSYTFEITVEPVVNHIQLYFEKPAGWADCYVYLWLPEPAGSLSTVTWPGSKMESLDDGWCLFDLPEATTSVNVIFNDGAGNQTGDLSRDATGWYSGSQWYDEDQTQDTTPPVISTSPAAGNHEATSLSVTIVLQDKDTTAKAYYTLDGSTATANSTPYNGVIPLNQDATINVYAIDKAGNHSTATFDFNLDADATKPEISVSLPAGRYDTNQQVVVSVTDNKDPQPDVYFTTDGTLPTTSSPRYTGNPIEILDINTGVDLHLQVLAIDNAGNEATASYLYRIGQATGTRDFREETIYFVMTARFFDGEPENNRPTRVYETSGNAANNDPAWRGDFQGLTAKLDYLKAMGFTAVWITPAVLNRSDYDFHGYHAYDFNRIDERLGGEEQFKRLIDELHKRDMKLVLDIVLNHTSRYGAVGLQTVKYFGIQNEQWDWYYDNENPSFQYDGLSYEPNSGKNYYNGDLWTSDNYLNLPGWGETAGIDHTTGRTIYNYQWPNLDLFSDDLFHTGWLKNWEDETAQNGTIHEDLPDLNTENAQVQQFLIDAYCRYIDMGVDAFRIDTVKHVSRLMFNRRFVPAFKDCGGDDFYMFGEVATRVNEVWNKNVAPLSTPFYTWAESKEYSDDDFVAVHEAYDYEVAQGPSNQPTSDNHHLLGNDYHKPDYSKSSGLSVIDFPMHWNFSDAGSAINIASQDYVYNDATWNVVYVDSHDYGPNMDNRYPGDDLAWAENMSYMWTFRGIPCLYYGSEIRFMAGAPADKAPTAPLAETGRAYYGDHIEGSVEVEDFGIYKNATGALATTMEQPLVKHLARLNRIRRAIPALQKGQYSRDDIDGWIAYKRRFTDEASGVDSFALVTVSGGATFSNIPNGTYKDAVTGDVKQVSNGVLTAELSGKGNMRVYVLDLPGNPAPGKIGEDTDYLN